MANSDMGDEPLERKAVRGVIEELERQCAENRARLKVRRAGDRVIVDGELDVDAIVMVVVGAMAGGP
ncbi:hypothetical protein [Pseudaminobacter sp. NGMCC 1.201702]|uniref:hypothetical protein n=1 Tax=Pseudaminobacter sp. NGMCC 1.201702 TaxID=3391825 RepID=UPI0039EF02E5